MFLKSKKRNENKFNGFSIRSGVFTFRTNENKKKKLNFPKNITIIW